MSGRLAGYAPPHRPIRTQTARYTVLHLMKRIAPQIWMRQLILEQAGLLMLVDLTYVHYASKTRVVRVMKYI